MSFLAVLFALILEQARPLGRGNAVHATFRHWAHWASRSLDAGRPHQRWIAWVVAVGLPTLLALLVHLLLWRVSGLLALVWNVAILYITLGFRQFSHFFTDIRDALEVGDEAAARDRLAQWRQIDASELPRSEIVRHVIEYSVLAAHRHVFGVLAWFSVLAAFGLGPAGAVWYRMSEFVARYWDYKSRSLSSTDGASPALAQAAAEAWSVIDYVPARLTSLGFAVVGSFEDAIDAWRAYVQRPDVAASPASNGHNDGVLLAATSGAVNVRLGGPEATAFAAGHGSVASSAMLGFSNADVGDDGMGSTTDAAEPMRRAPQVAHLRSIVGLVWRSVVLWMVLLALLTLARLLG